MEPKSKLFKPGSAVEISPDDEGFRGSLFTGKVIRHLDNKRVLVEYDYLVEEDESDSKQKQLREVLYLHQLRPPLPIEISREFKFGDEVDAFHHDGWWEGHITKECGNGRFAVYFRVSGEQIEFNKEELRLHREWFDDNYWVPPFQQKQEPQQEVVADTMTEGGRFSVGTPVEVSSDEEGFQGAWFSATVVRVIGQGKFLIEYQSLLVDDESQLLREEVDTQHIRPQPPQIDTIGQFNHLEEVDVLHNDGWWVGMVSKVLDNSRYVVFFENSNEELEFRHSELRKHQEWIDGKWTMAS
ncbi:hypothetical protein RIF29_22443 [Crotalaria pallida]|uniref:Agenet domain-containing protein n=1 Tax=Crotalaria pallida TaxID=3830 RepID=A0AAN9I9D2_CROPI